VQSTSPLSKTLVWTAILLVPVACFVYFLSRFGYLPGTDAYYYALQTESLLDFGRLKVHDGSVLYYFVAAVSRSGLSIEMSFKFVLAAIYGIYNLGFLLLVTRLKEKTRPLAALLWVVSGSVAAFHVIEFPNLSMGLVTIPLWFWFLMGRRKRRLLWLAALLVACAFLHPALAALVSMFIATVYLGWTASAGALKRFRIKGFVVGMISVALALLAVMLKWSGFGWRLKSLAWGKPGLFALATATGLPFDMKVGVLFFWISLALLYFAYLRSGSGKWTYLIAATLTLPLWPDPEGGLNGLGGRLAGLFVFLALPLIVLVYDDLGTRGKGFAWMQAPRTLQITTLVFIAAMAVLPIRLENYTRLLMSNDYGQYEKVVAALERDDIHMLIAKQGLDFFYTYRLRRDAFHFDPEPNWNRAQIWRVAARITPEEVAYYSSPSCVWGKAARTIEDTDYLLVREDCWENLRARLNPNENPDLYTEVWKDMENPSEPRPAFLRVRHRDSTTGAFPALAGGKQ
jgi:hypothetical protein